MSSNPAGRVSCEICTKNVATSMDTGGRWPVAASPEKKICYYFWVFSHFHFAECKSLPSAFPALGKGFAECPTKSTRQRLFCRLILCRVPFAECGTQQSLCRVYFGLCRVPQALGKVPVSSSATCMGVGNTDQRYFLRWFVTKNTFINQVLGRSSFLLSTGLRKRKDEMSLKIIYVAVYRLEFTDSSLSADFQKQVHTGAE